MVKFLDLTKQYYAMKEEMDAAIFSTIENSAFIGGASVAQFEESFAVFQDAKYCVGVGNGTDAIEILLEALKLPLGSEIIVPANSFIASSEAVTRSGYTVVFCDNDPGYYTIDIASLESKITDKTSAIIAVHLYGQPCDMDAICAIAKKHNLAIIEDCAQAHGAVYKGKKVGTFGAGSTFSFYPGKNLGAYGDGGAIVTNDENTAVRCRMIANHGRIAKYDHEFEGRNSRLDGLQAAILNVKMKYLPQWLEARVAVADFYMTNLQGIEGLVIPKRRQDVTHVYHLFVVRTEKRDELQSFLKEKGIQTGIHYPIALHKLGAYATHTELPKSNAEDFAPTLLSLPIGEHLTQEDMQQVVDAVREFFA